MKSQFSALCILFAGLTFAPACLGGSITYDTEQDCIWVAGFPEESPAMLGTVLKADQENGWGKVSYDQATDTYGINTSLWIGTDQDAGTFFQIGSKEHPKETLTIKGDFWIRPPKKSQRRRTDRRFAIVNRLTVGDLNDASIQPTIKIDCSQPQEFGLFVGLGGSKAGGDLYLYNCMVTAAQPDQDHVQRGVDYAKAKDGFIGGWWPTDLRLINSTISWMGGSLYLGAPAAGPNLTRQQSHCIIDGATFENIPQVRFLNPCEVYSEARWEAAPMFIKNCTFRNLENVVAPNGEGIFVNCRFENNRNNLSLVPAHSGAILIDCHLGPQKDPIAVAKTTIPVEKLRRYGNILNPGLGQGQSLLVAVVDQKGRPVPAALVMVASEDDQSAVVSGIAVTNEQGLTSTDVEKDALIIVNRRYLPTDDPTQPEEKPYSFQVAVRATGYQTETAAISRGQTRIARPLKVVLKKQ